MKSPPIFYDTHAHLDGSDFAADQPEAIERARVAGITKIVTVGTDQVSSEAAIRIADAHPNVFAVVGWHPNDSRKAPEDIRPALRELARHPKVVALGEMGLDYYRLPKVTSDAIATEVAAIKKIQARVFSQQLDLAAELGLNCVVHQRGDCFEDTIGLMRPYANRLRAVFHCFSEGPANLARVLELGFYVSFTGIITFRTADVMRASLAATPANRFMLETDCPYLAPEPYRGKRCEPAYIAETAAVAARVRNCSLEELSASTCATAREFYRISSPLIP